MRVDAEVMHARVGVGNVLEAVLEIQSPMVREQVTSAGSQIEVEIERLSDDVPINVG